jgi:hypothetical protein
VSTVQHEQDRETSGMLGASGLMERLLHVQKRKRAFGRQTGEAHSQAIRRQLEAERQEKRGH